MPETPRPVTEAEKPKPVTKPQEAQRNYTPSNKARRSLQSGEPETDG